MDRIYLAIGRIIHHAPSKHTAMFCRMFGCSITLIDRSRATASSIKKQVVCARAKIIDVHTYLQDRHLVKLGCLHTKGECAYVSVSLYCVLQK
jgi:hypothetical protein